MWWLIGLYIIPGMITTWLMSKFIEYIKEDELKTIDDDYSTLITVASFCPILNIFCAILLIYWYICIPKS